MQPPDGWEANRAVGRGSPFSAKSVSSLDDNESGAGEWAPLLKFGSIHTKDNTPAHVPRALDGRGSYVEVVGQGGAEDDEALIPFGLDIDDGNGSAAHSSGYVVYVHVHVHV